MKLKPCLKGHKSIFSGTRGNDKTWLITCLTCEKKRIETQFFMVYASTEEKAETLWNSRPGEDAARAEALKDAVKAIEACRDGAVHFSSSKDYDERVEHWSASCIAAIKDLAKGEA